MSAKCISIPPNVPKMYCDRETMLAEQDDSEKSTTTIVASCSNGFTIKSLRQLSCHCRAWFEEMD